MTNRAFMLKRTRTLRAFVAACAAAVLVAGCSDPLSPERDFLIRTPKRVTTAARPATFQASTGSTDMMLFEWSPAQGADSYTITFWQGENEAEIERLEADFSTTLMSFEVSSPQVTEVPVNPSNPDDPRRVKLVRYEVPLSDVAELLQAAGVQPGSVYTLLSIYARNGGDEWRSSSLTPVIFQLQP